MQRIIGMSQRKRLTIIWGCIDTVIIFGVYSLVYTVRSITAIFEYFEHLDFVVFAVAVTLVSLYISKTYHRIWLYTSGHGILIIIRAVAAAGVLIVIVDLAIIPRPAPLSVVIVSHLLITGGLIGARYRSRLISGLSWRWRAVWDREFPKPEKVQVLIIGAGESGQTLAWRLEHRMGDTHHHIIGFIDDDPKKQSLYIENLPVLGTRNDIIRIAETHGVDLIVVAIHNITGQDFREILGICEQTKARIKIVPNMLALINNFDGHHALRDIQPEDLIGRRVVTRHKEVDLSPMMGRVVLVTGAAGSIGSELAHQLVTYQPQELILLDNNESDLHDLLVAMQAKYPHLNLAIELVDITNRDALSEVFRRRRPQVVFHAAAYKHVPMLEQFPREAIRVNVGGTYHLVQLAKRYHVERFVLISTDKAVHPSSVMGASKRLCELILHMTVLQNDSQTLFTSVRFGNVLGSRGSVIPTFDHQINSGGPLTVTDPEMTRYFMSTLEAANLVIHAACLTTGDDVFVLQMGEVVRILDLAERMIRMRGLRPHVDVKIIFTGVRPGEKLHEELFDEDEDPMPTVHPHIVKLYPWNNGSFAPDAFQKNIERLMEQGIDERYSALEQLMDIMYSVHNLSMGAD